MTQQVWRFPDISSLFRPCFVFAVWLCGGFLYLACNPIPVQLAPNWPKNTTTDGGTSSSTDGGTVADSERPNITCSQASASQLQLIPGISLKSGALLVGTLGSEAANKEISVQVPQEWQATPTQVRADVQGQFGFVIHGPGIPGADQGEIAVFHRNQWCYTLQTHNALAENQKTIKLPSSLTCTQGSSPTLLVELQGRPQAEMVGYSSRPDLVEIVSLKISTGKPVLQIEVRCLQAGSATLLFGGMDLEGTAIPLTISP